MTTTWGWGVNLGLLYEIDKATRLGSDLELAGGPRLQWRRPQFSNLAPGLGTALEQQGAAQREHQGRDQGSRSRLMGSIFTQVNDRWALLGSVGWQQWSKFGQVQLGIDNTTNPTSTTTDLDFKDTWHVAVGAQYRLSKPWLLNFGIAYDSGFQDGSSVSPLLPVNSAWRFGVGAQHQLSETFFWGVAAEYLYGGTLDTNLQSTLPVALGGRGNLVGSYNNLSTFFLACMPTGSSKAEGIGH